MFLLTGKKGCHDTVGSHFAVHFSFCVCAKCNREMSRKPSVAIPPPLLSVPYFANSRSVNILVPSPKSLVNSESLLCRASCESMFTIAVLVLTLLLMHFACLAPFILRYPLCRPCFHSVPQQGGHFASVPTLKPFSFLVFKDAK